MNYNLKPAARPRPARGGRARDGRLLRSAAAAAALFSVMAAPLCRADGEPGLRVVATTGMVADLAARVAGPRATVTALMGPGVDPHLYKPSTADTARLARADVIFYNGLMLEGRMGKLLERLGRTGRRVRAVTDGIPREALIQPQGFAGHPDPHVWFDPALWSRTVPVIVETLSGADPAAAEEFRARGAELERRLAELNGWCRAMAERLPAERRVLVTSHDAFNYFGRAFGFRVIGLQGFSTVSEASLADVASLADFLKRERVPAVFVESSVNPEAMRRVAEAGGARIGGELFSDALGSPGELRRGHDTGTYEGMMRANMETIVEALKPE